MTTEVQTHTEPQPQDASNLCWVCYDGPRPSSPLIQPCACPRTVHAECCARWQLHAAGKAEEHTCRFCQQKLPDWQNILTPYEAQLPAQCLPTMSVTFNDQQHHIVAQSGPDGYAAFEAEVRRIFGIEAEMDMNLVFDCAEPTTGSLLKLNGPGAFNAAVHCAKVSAAKRLRRCQAEQISKGMPSTRQISQGELEDLVLAEDLEPAVLGAIAEPTAQSEVAYVQPDSLVAGKAPLQPTEDQLAAAFNRMSSSSSASFSGSATGSASGSASGVGSHGLPELQPLTPDNNRGSQLPRFHRRYRSGRRVVSPSLSVDSLQDSEPQAAPQASEDVRRSGRTRPRAATTMSDLLEALCRVLATQRNSRRCSRRPQGLNGISYGTPLEMDQVYYNTGFQPQLVPEPAELEVPSRNEAVPVSPLQDASPCSSSLDSSTSRFQT